MDLAIFYLRGHNNVDLLRIIHRGGGENRLVRAEFKPRRTLRAHRASGSLA